MRYLCFVGMYALTWPRSTLSFKQTEHDITISNAIYLLYLKV